MATDLMVLAAVVGIASYILLGSIPRWLVIAFVILVAVIVF